MTILNKIRKSTFLLKNIHSRIHVSYLKGIPEVKLAEVLNNYKLKKGDKIYILIESFSNQLSAKFYFIVSGKGISCFPDDQGSFMMWEEIEKTEYMEDEMGKWFVIHFYKTINFSYNVFDFKIRKEFWIKLSELVNQIINSIQAHENKIISRLVDLCEKNPNDKEYLNLKNIYVTQFKEAFYIKCSRDF